MSKFLGKDGLTQTSANHIANIAKEMYESLEAKVDSIRLISRDYTLALNGQQYRLENESSKEEFLAISASLKEIASLKSLIAWLREGIKAKEELCTYTAECKWLDEQIKAGHEELKEPETGETVSFESILAGEPIDRQVRYYALEARCATLGKYIHPDGHLSSARKEFYDKQKIRHRSAVPVKMQKSTHIRLYLPVRRLMKSFSLFRRNTARFRLSSIR